MGTDDHPEVVEATSAAVIRLYRSSLLFQIAGIALVFGIWQARELQQPWWNGPWHVVFFAWLAGYASWASYSRRARRIRTAASRFEAHGKEVSSQRDGWLESMGFRLQRSRLEAFGCLLLPVLAVLAAAALTAEAVSAVYRRGLSFRRWIEPLLLALAIGLLSALPTFGIWPIALALGHACLAFGTRQYLNVT